MTGYAQVLEELDATNNSLVKSYTLGDDVLSQAVGGTTSYLQYDGHGSTRLLTNASSAVASRFDYDAYGKNLFSVNITSPAATDMLYSGEQFDTNLQMQYLRARYYDQSNGTFNKLDPFNGNMGDPKSLHKYAYCHGDGVNIINPSGKFGVVGTILVFVFSAILFFTTTSFNPKSKAADAGVVFVSDREVGGAYLLPFLSKYYAIFNVKNPKDLVEKAENFHNETGSYIKDFVLSGHGFHAGVQTNAGMDVLPFAQWKYPQDAEHNRADERKNLYIQYFSRGLIDRLKKLFIKDSKYISYGCGSGADEKGLQHTANLLEIPAIGFTGNVRVDGFPRYEHGQNWH